MLSCREIKLDEQINWDTLVEESSTVSFFQTKEWLTLWIQHFPVEVKILGVFEGEELIGFAPFSIVDQTVNFLGTTPVLGGEFVSDFGDIVAKKGREKEVWKTVLEGIRDQGSGISLLRPETRQLKPYLELDFIREDSPSFEILKNLGGKAEEVDVAPYIDLPKTWDEYLVSLDRHDRHELRRKIRKLEQEEAFSRYYEGNPEDIEDFFRLMGKSNEKKRDFLKPEMKAFFKDIIDVFWVKQQLELCFLKYRGKNITAILYFIFNNEVLLYNSGFDPTFSPLSPGFVLAALAIKNSIEKGRKRFDFLRGNERYKYDLGGRERKLYKIRFQGSGVSNET